MVSSGHLEAQVAYCYYLAMRLVLAPAPAVLLIALAAACGGDEEGAPLDQSGSADSGEAKDASCRSTESATVCDLGCEIIPGIDTGLTPQPEATPPFDCSPRPGLDGSIIDLGGVRGYLNRPMPPLPSGLVAVSDYLEFDFDDAEPPAIAGFVLPLTEEIADPSTTAFYTYRDGEWQRFADVVVVLNSRAEGAFESIPPNIAVLKDVR